MTFNKDALLKLLDMIDEELEKKAKIHIIGGSALTIAFGSKKGTKDIDTWENEENIKKAHRAVLNKHPEIKIPLAPAYVHIHSNEMKARFKKYDKQSFKKLTIYIPEPEDLFLLKAQRADEKDLQDLIDLNKVSSLSDELILNRFREELLPQNPGSDEDLLIKYLTTIEKIFGDKAAENHAKQLNFS